MEKTTHFNKALMDKVGITRGEGFFNGTDYTDEYLFYSKEWENKDDHPSYPNKRMKKYFIGDATKSVETQYRLRSIYIPNEYDVDDESTGKASGNKDYRCFETWNISETGDFGGYTVSGQMNTDPQHSDRHDERWHFFRGDMAWASIFVAPAFCL